MLSNESIQKLNEGYAARMKAASTSLPIAQTPTTQPSLVSPQTEKTLQGNRTSETPVRMYGDISPEEQIQKFGGLVGSPEYYATKAKESAGMSITKRVGPVVGATAAGFAVGGPFGALAGAGLGAGVMADLYPNQETWDRMATTDKITHVIDKTVEGGIKLAFALPVAFAKAIPNLASYAIRPVVEKVNPFTPTGVQELAKREETKPYTLNVGGREVTTLDPIYTNVVDSFKAAKTAGFNDSVSTVYGYFQGGVQIINEALVGTLFAKGLKTLAVPPKRLAPGETVANTVPVTAMFKSTQEALKKEGGIRTKDGPASMYSSVPVEFGNEVAKQTGKSGRVFYKITPAGQGSVEVALVQNVGGLVDSLKRRIGLGDEGVIVGAAGPEIKIESHIVKVSSGDISQGAGRVMPITEPYKGSENRPITRVQVDNVSNISKMNEIDPAVTDIVVKTMTGKSVIGELTNAEYVKVAKTLSGMNKLGEYATGGKASLWVKYVGQYVSPPRSWMEAVQRKTHVPIYDTWLDIENGFKMAKTTQEAYMNEGRTIFGKYADDSFTEQRRLVDAHMHGDKNAIVNNASLSPEVKTELLKVVDDVSQFFEQHGVDLGVEKTAYRKNDAGYYLPDVIDLGGILQMYKSEAKGGLPDGREFFAKQKKKGGGYVRIDDPLKLIDIYARDGAKAKFISEPLARAAEIEKTKIPEAFRGSFRSAVLEKSGYAGGFEKFLDEVSSRMNQYMNRNVPPDLGRKINQGVFTYAYVNALSSPGTWIRNELMNNVMLYSRLGTEFWPQAKAKALTSEGLAEVRKAGFLNEYSQPFGEDVGSVGGKIKKVAEVALTPQGLSDSTGRATAYFQIEFKFEDAIKKYNEGKITWQQAEKSMGMDGMSPIEAQRIRSNIQAKNMEGAFQELARSVIDETNFPFRGGSSSRITFGETGKIATFLYKWQIEYTHTMGRWLRTGQTDKFVRYYIASTAAVKSLKEAYGLDFTSSLFLGPVNAKYPPTVQIGLDTLTVLQAQTDDNAQAIDDAKESLVNHLKNFGVPGGVDKKNWDTFWRSYEKGPDRNGLYGIYGPKGDMMEDPVPFHEIWKRLFGLPTVTKVQTATALKEAANRTNEISKARRKVAELRNAGKDDEADAIVLEWEAQGEDIEPGNQSYDRFEIPRTERVFEKLTPGSQEALESKFYPKK